MGGGRIEPLTEELLGGSVEGTQNALIEVFKTYLKRENKCFQPRVPEAGRSSDVILSPGHGADTGT